MCGRVLGKNKLCAEDEGEAEGSYSRAKRRGRHQTASGALNPKRQRIGYNITLCDYRLCKVTALTLLYPSFVALGLPCPGYLHCGVIARQNSRCMWASHVFTKSANHFLWMTVH
jgi:hypothetical protein